MPSATASVLRAEHELLDQPLNRLQAIADKLDAADADEAVALLVEANDIVASKIVEHERADEAHVYPSLETYLSDRHGLGAMSRAHREILHLARLLERLVAELTPATADRYLVRDGQRTIEALEALVRLHNAQEDDIYDFASAQGG